MERRPRQTTINHSKQEINSAARKSADRERAASYSRERVSNSPERKRTSSQRTSSGSRSRSSSGTRSRSYSETRSRASSGNRNRASSGTRSRSSSGRTGSAYASGKRPSSGARRPASRNRASQAALKRKKTLAIAIAALVAVIAVVVIIIVSSLHVPEPTELKIESSSSSQILSWKGQPKKVSYQIFRKGPHSSDFEMVSEIPLEGECSYVSSDLSSASLYEYKVLAIKGKDKNARKGKGQVVSAYTLPETLTDCSARTMSKDSLTVSWNNSQPVSGYELNYGLSKDLSDASTLSISPSEVEKNSDTGMESYQIPNLPVGSTYYFEVRSFCGDQVYSEWSESFSGTVTQAVDMTGIDIHKPMVALTFDDGPDRGEYTNRILDTLKAYGAHASFFQLGQLAEQYPDVVKRIAEEGHELACHTYDHSHMGNAVTAEDITRANDALEKNSGVWPSSFRSPGGETTDLIRSVCAEQGQAIFHWSIDTRDWQSRDADAIMNEVQSQGIGDGDIILLHNIYESSAAATERLVPWIIEQGYQVVSASQLIQAKTGNPPEPGVQYFSATRSN